MYLYFRKPFSLPSGWKGVLGVGVGVGGGIVGHLGRLLDFCVVEHQFWLRLLIPLCEKIFFLGSFAAFFYFCSWNDDKDKQSGESESNLWVWYLRTWGEMLNTMQDKSWKYWCQLWLLQISSPPPPTNFIFLVNCGTLRFHCHHKTSSFFSLKLS